ncbi:ATP-binding protein [Nocardia sp. CDC159]|uniref:histidine kinase n=1 Tax=Nocardia pulmonis TaxID=2951408 RepID=A0A9X2E3B7_9NOCA|nr:MULTISPECIES: ATP-binding protein [Nocardia]MCM6772080.1 ATP-binding protein [Nocardia pulmonis]MCM6785262.1 ATP-binding protein [Nocardia sp. CDC159]
MTVAVWLAPPSIRPALTIGGGVAAALLCAALTAAVRYRQAAVIARTALERVERAAADRTAEAAAALAAARDTAAAQAREAKQSEVRRAAAMAAFAGAAGRMQAMTTSMLAELREMEHRHADPTVLADLLALDHRTAQAGRLADSIAVLSGARSGRRWAKPIAMESILRGAMGRVAGYQRVRLRAVAEIAIAGHAAEGIMHALAELLDNACNFSPPTTEVHVYAAEVPAGVVVTIEDSGLIMSDSALRRAERAVAGIGANGRRGATALDLSSLTGTRLGLAVVGHLARKHGLTVSYRPSAIGGTAVVVVVPRELILRLDRSPGSVATLTLPAAQPAEPPPAPEASTPEITLPKRRRGSTLAAVHPDGLSAPPPPSAPPAATPARPSALAAFQRAVSGRTEPSNSVAVEKDR